MILQIIGWKQLKCLIMRKNIRYVTTCLFFCIGFFLVSMDLLPFLGFTLPHFLQLEHDWIISILFFFSQHYSVRHKSYIFTGVCLLLRRFTNLRLPKTLSVKMEVLVTKKETNHEVEVKKNKITSIQHQVTIFTFTLNQIISFYIPNISVIILLEGVKYYNLRWKM